MSLRRGLTCTRSKKNLRPEGESAMHAYTMSTADKIKALRRDHGLTQEDLAAKSGCGLATIQRAESGKRLSPDSIASIAAAFGIEATDLTVDANASFEPYLPLE